MAVNLQGNNGFEKAVELMSSRDLEPGAGVQDDDTSVAGSQDGSADGESSEDECAQVVDAEEMDPDLWRENNERDENRKMEIVKKVKLLQAQLAQLKQENDAIVKSQKANRKRVVRRLTLSVLERYHGLLMAELKGCVVDLGLQEEFGRYGEEFMREHYIGKFDLSSPRTKRKKTSKNSKKNSKKKNTIWGGKYDCEFERIPGYKKKCVTMRKRKTDGRVEYAIPEVRVLTNEDATYLRYVRAGASESEQQSSFPDGIYPWTTVKPNPEGP